MKHIYTRLLCGLTFGLATVLSAAADGTKGVVLISTDGSQHQMLLEHVDRMEIGPTATTLKHIEGTSHTVEHKDIDRIMIGAEVTSIGLIAAPGEIAVWPTTATDVVNISGLEAGTAISLFDIKGSKVKTVAGVDGITTIGVENLPTGVYVVTFGSQSVKIIKK